MDRQMYISVAHHKLHDTNVYVSDIDPTDNIIAEINTTLARLIDEGVTSKDRADFADPRETKPGRS